MKTRTSDLELCALCGGRRVSGRTTFVADLETVVVVVRNVPATVCNQCGADWIDDATAAELEQHVQNASQRGAQVEVLAMP